MAYGYLTGLFDILGFEQRLSNIGLREMVARYEALIKTVDYCKVQAQRVFGDFGLKESPYWLSDGDVFLFTKNFGAYASDSILLWAERAWPDARDKDAAQIREMAQDPAKGWAYQPVPCDNFLDVCNDLICRSIEVGLPLRGALAVGDGVFDGGRNIFLGQPIIEAARLEPCQKFIGVSLCRSFVDQIIPKRFTLSFSEHLKSDDSPYWGGFVLDWPRHWRNTRKENIVDAVQILDTDPRYAAYYANTLNFIAYSQKFAEQFESVRETSIRANYEAFSFSNEELAVPACALRRVTIPSDKQ